MTQNADKKKGSKISRRRFLTGISAGAVASAISLPNVVHAHPTGQSIDQVNNKNFSRLFPNLPAFVQASDEARAAMIDIGKPGGLMDAKDPLQEGPVRLITNPELSPNNRDNPAHTAGVTFLGQFLDHDMTFDTTSFLGVPKRPEDSLNTRNPVFDLDTVYGGGPSASSHLYRSDRIKFKVESGGQFEDLPRGADNTAIIADPRNDENMMLSGLQVMFLRAHNNAVDLLSSQGVPRSQQFAKAQELIRRHYQWIIVNEFLPLVCGNSVVRDILRNGRRFYRPQEGQQTIPVEFQVAYRMGHSMIRPSYRANLAGDNGLPFFGFIFDPAGQGRSDPVDLRGGARARRRFIGWQTFFNFGDGNVRPNKRLDTKLSTPLFRLPLNTIAGPETGVISLAARNLLRSITWSLPSGIEVARAMGVQALNSDNFSELRQYGGNLRLASNPPLWYYVLREADLMADGLNLGPMGGRLVAEVFIGLLQLDPNSYLRQNNWRPSLPAQQSGTFNMTDLLRFAQVDPGSRGQ